MESNQLLIVFGFVALMLALLFLITSHNYRRRKGLAALAKELGFTYEREATQLLEQFKRSRLFPVGSNQRITNLLKGKTGSAMVWLLDYSYFAGGKHYKDNTICVVRSEYVKLPYFYLKCQMAGMHKLDSFLKENGLLPEQFRGKEIDFPQDEEFSKKFVLLGREEAVRPLFDIDLRHHILRFAGSLVEIEGNGNTLLFTTGTPLLPKEVREVIQQATDLFAFLSRRTASRENASERYADTVKSLPKDASWAKAGDGSPAENLFQRTGPEKKGRGSSIVLKGIMFLVGAILGVLGSIIIFTEMKSSLAGGTAALNNAFMIGLAFFVAGLGIVLQITLGFVLKRRRAKLINRELEDMSIIEGSGDSKKAKKEK
jgi:hypothetical protein